MSTIVMWLNADPVVIDHQTAWAAAVTAIAVSVGMICQIVLQLLARVEQQRQARLDAERSAAAQRAAEEARTAALRAVSAASALRDRLDDVTTETDAKLDLLTKAAGKASVSLDAAHSLANSAHGVTLRMNAELSRWKADATENPDHAAAAVQAERLYHDHEAAQAKADAKTDR